MLSYGWETMSGVVRVDVGIGLPPGEVDKSLSQLYTHYTHTSHNLFPITNIHVLTSAGLAFGQPGWPFLTINPGAVALGSGIAEPPCGGLLFASFPGLMAPGQPGSLFHAHIHIHTYTTWPLSVQETLNKCLLNLAISQRVVSYPTIISRHT